jgi:hypothetical protein
MKTMMTTLVLVTMLFGCGAVEGEIQGIASVAPCDDECTWPSAWAIHGDMVVWEGCELYEGEPGACGEWEWVTVVITPEGAVSAPFDTGTGDHWWDNGIVLLPE